MRRHPRQWDRVMRCVACGVEMRIVRKVPDQSMMVTGHELHTFECPGCGSKEQRFVFTRNIDQLHPEPMHLPSPISTSGALIRHKMSVAARAAQAQMHLASAALGKRLDEMVTQAAHMSCKWRGRIRYLLADRR
jgi:hypothetical protein